MSIEKRYLGSGFGGTFWNNNLKAFCFLLGLVFLFFALTAKAEQKVKDPQAMDAVETVGHMPAPVKVKVGIYVLNMGKVDIATGTYTVDCFISFVSDQDMGNQKFEFMNGRAGSTDVLIDTPKEKFWRMQVNLMANLDLKKYPWDEHDLPIIIEHSTRTKNELVYEIDQAKTGIDPSVIFVGWNLLGNSLKISDHFYPVYNETYSQLRFNIRIGRIVLVSSIKTFLPVICFMIITFISLLVNLDKLDSRVGMNTAMLIASVMFHLSIGSQLPAVGYLTMADKILIATYATIGINLIMTVLMMRAMQTGKDVYAKQLKAFSIKFIPSFGTAMYLLTFLTAAWS